jgi:hypothetical protein
MSAERRHTDVPELGWLDFIAACDEDDLVRVEGHDIEKTHAAGRLVRFNLAVQVMPETARWLHGQPPRVHARRTRRVGDALVPTDLTVELKWEEVDWVSWEPLANPNGRRLKLTVEGESNFGRLQVWEGGRLVDTVTRRVTDYGSHAKALAAALKLIGR